LPPGQEKEEGLDRLAQQLLHVVGGERLAHPIDAFGTQSDRVVLDEGDREVAGKLDGISIRVPTPNVSVVDLKFIAKRATTKDEINAAVKRAAKQQLKGILGFTEAPNVSTDFNHDPHSSVFHMDQTKVIDGTLVRVMSWYDNEWGFSNRMVDTAVAMGKL